MLPSKVDLSFWLAEFLGIVHMLVGSEGGKAGHGVGVLAPMLDRGIGAQGPHLLLGEIMDYCQVVQDNINCPGTSMTAKKEESSSRV